VKQACEHPFVKPGRVCAKCKLLVRFDYCPTCALDVPLSQAATMSIWAELQLRADNPMTAQTEAIQEAARLLRDVLYEKGCSADPAITAWLSRDIV
jgi:hypothetical protein